MQSELVQSLVEGAGGQAVKPGGVDEFVRSGCLFCNDWVTNRHAIKLLNRTPVTMFVGCGRSGTKWLSAALKRPKVISSHESFWRYDFHRAPRPGATRRHRHLFFKVRRALLYEMLIFVKKTMGITAQAYIEPNSMLSYFPKDLGNFFRARVGLLARNPVDTVRSLMSRKIYRPDDTGYRAMEPREGDPFENSWPRMDRVARLAWFWQNAVNCALEGAEAVFALDELTTSEEVYSRCCEFSRVSVNLDHWNKIKGMKINRSRGDQRLTSSDIGTILAICGPTVERLRHDHGIWQG